ncbi:hypothetical protein PR202_gb07157 [Eleusine coracana subsp. coracana]|uniref:HAMP domain-containing protein n=1 Tax=Eleusine coracana subsp. coracana TaxID=191504 RepID=A0AAV5E900_ELECO|nr:hypothetical protein QOZ80_2BG0166570 [Eleusine coracana subsp. coracana]GJN19844.1 hypothetical protein PR202_gb07157 [Eleusine coracana subsp. coracana]
MARSLFPLLPLLVVVFSCSSWCGGGGALAARPSPSDSDAAAAAGFVRSWCAGTEYPALCDSTVGPYAAEVGSSPARLSWAALTVTLDGARNASAAMRRMAASGRLPRVAAEAARDCVGMLGDAVEMLRQSVEAMARLGEDDQQKSNGNSSSRSSVRFQVDSVQTWASAALTDDDTCLEGFRAVEAGARETVRGHVAGVAHLTANALAIVNAMAKQMPQS